MTLYLKPYAKTKTKTENYSGPSIYGTSALAPKTPQPPLTREEIYIHNSRIINELIAKYIPVIENRDEILAITNMLKIALKNANCSEGITKDIETIIKAYLYVKDLRRRYSSDKDRDDSLDDILEDVRKQVQGKLNNAEIYEDMWPRQYRTVRELPISYLDSSEYKRQEKIKYCKDLLDNLVNNGQMNANGTVFTYDTEILKNIDEIDIQRIIIILDAIKKGVKFEKRYIPYTEKNFVKRYYLTHEMIVRLYEDLRIQSPNTKIRKIVGRPNRVGFLGTETSAPQSQILQQKPGEPLARDMRFNADENELKKIEGSFSRTDIFKQEPLSKQTNTKTSENIIAEPESAKVRKAENTKVTVKPVKKTKPTRVPVKKVSEEELMQSNAETIMKRRREELVAKLQINDEPKIVKPRKIKPIEVKKSKPKVGERIIGYR